MTVLVGCGGGRSDDTRDRPETDSSQFVRAALQIRERMNRSHLPRDIRPMNIVPGDFADPRIVELLRVHLTAARAVTPPGSVHALDLSGLRAADVASGRRGRARC